MDPPPSQALSGSCSVRKTTLKLLMPHILLLCEKIRVGSEVTCRRTCTAVGKDWQVQIWTLGKGFDKPGGWKGEEKCEIIL